MQDFALKWETLSQSLTEEYYNTKSNNSSDKEDYENNDLIDETILDNNITYREKVLVVNHLTKSVTFAVFLYWFAIICIPMHIQDFI